MCPVWKLFPPARKMQCYNNSHYIIQCFIRWVKVPHPDVRPGFFFICPHKPIRRGLPDPDMTTGQGVLASIPVTLHQQLDAANQDANPSADRRCIRLF